MSMYGSRGYMGFASRADHFDFTYKYERELALIEEDERLEAEAKARAYYERDDASDISKVEFESMEALHVGDLVRVVASRAPNHPHEFPIGTVLPVLEIYEDGSGVDLGDWSCRLDEVEKVCRS